MEQSCKGSAMWDIHVAVDHQRQGRLEAHLTWKLCKWKEQLRNKYKKIAEMTMPKSIYRLQKIKIQSSKKLSEKLGVVQ